MRPLRLTWLFFRMGALNELQYRANFWLQLLQSAIQLGTGLAVLGLIFSQTPALNGWTPAELLAVMGVHILMGGVIGALIQPSMERLRQDIRQGTFDFVLTVAFWIVRIDEIAELFQGVYQSGRWPVTIYPDWLRASLTYLIPIAFAVTVPAQALTGRLTPDT